MPGAVEAMHRLVSAGIHLVVFTSRIAPVDPWGVPRPEADVHREIANVRQWLDEHGLSFMQLHTDPWKPGASVYVDDKAERYTGRPGSWPKLTQKILARCGVPTSEFPPLIREEAWPYGR